jgi:hypothetical protein
MNQDALIDAAEKYVEPYEADTAQYSGSMLMSALLNAFYAGANWQQSSEEPSA